jgi:hypothetical protein
MARRRRVAARRHPGVHDACSSRANQARGLAANLPRTRMRGRAAHDATLGTRGRHGSCAPQS